MSVPSIAKRVLQHPRGRHSASLEANIEISSDVTFTPVTAGTVGHRDPTSKKFKTGVPATNDTGFVPLIAFQHSDDPDIVLPNSMSYSSEANAYVSGVDSDLDSTGTAAPKGPLFLIGIDHYILESEKFLDEATLGSTYLPGNTLTATPADTNATTGGRLTKGAVKAAQIVGMVWNGVSTNLEGRSVLSWITWYFPKLS